MKQLNRMRGISLIEVIIAFAITAVLVAATMPNYHDYTVRARVAEGLRLTEPARQALVDTCLADGSAVVGSNADAGFHYRRPPAEVDFIDRLVLAADCGKKELTVMVWMTQTGATPEPVIELRAWVPSGVLSNGFEAPYRWHCRLIRGDFADVPPDCRKLYRKG
ncbi:MAG: prepilin-type N-terminal cleavage/methylation domain-containing protein [Xanthomonadales bacterium]